MSAAAARQTRPTASVVDVTPKLAESWLGKNKRNRNLRPRVVDAYVRDMLAGHWQLTGEAVKFDTDGNLIDGQHRLSAVVDAGITVPMFVVEGVESRAQDVLDTGSRRTTADSLKLDGYRNTTVLAATARLAMKHRDGGMSKGTKSLRIYTTSDVREFIDDNPDLTSAVDELQNLKGRIDLTLSTACFCGWLLARVDADDASKFWTSLANNATDGAGDPRNALLRRLSNARRTNEHLSVETQVALVLRAWNAWRRGQQLTSLPVSSYTGEIAVPKPI